MKATEIIKKLQEIINEHGDINVGIDVYDSDRDIREEWSGDDENVDLEVYWDDAHNTGAWIALSNYESINHYRGDESDNEDFDESDEYCNCDDCDECYGLNDNCMYNGMDVNDYEFEEALRKMED